MKTGNIRFWVLTAVMLLPGLLCAQSFSSQDVEEATAFSNDKGAAPANPAQLQTKDATLNTISALMRNKRTSAGVEMSKSVNPKSMEIGTAATPQVCEWFKKPAIYADYGYGTARDRREKALATDQQQFTVGGDFETIGGVTLGAMYSSVWDHGSTQNNTVQIHSQTDTNLWSAYAGKNFMDWINVGGSFTFSKAAVDISEFRLFPSLDRNVDSYAGAVFVGASHTWGAWQLSSTPTLIYQKDQIQYLASGRFPGALPSYDLDTTRFTWLNTVDYSITDKFQIGGLFHWTHLVDQSHDPSPRLTNDDHSWVTTGIRLTYFPIENLQTTVSYETDLLNRYNEDHRIRCGLTYSF